MIVTAPIRGELREEGRLRMQTINVNPKILKELGVQPFDVADYLQTDEDIVEYLSQVLSEGDTDELVRATGYVAKARGMSQIAKDSGLCTIQQGGLQN